MVMHNARTSNVGPGSHVLERFVLHLRICSRKSFGMISVLHLRGMFLADMFAFGWFVVLHCDMGYESLRLALREKIRLYEEPSDVRKIY